MFLDPGFNATHPELREGEICFTNIHFTPSSSIPNALPEEGEEEWHAIQYKTKRLSNTGYDMYGNVVPEIRAVFVQKWEWEAK